ncbi:porin [Paraburkholderia sp. Ac-20347]|uniref:porin n=1 Tax=Paraburkholderia sp. Ac-20347 TaxID=2703892 RepID=UPI003217863D
MDCVNYYMRIKTAMRYRSAIFICASLIGTCVGSSSAWATESPPWVLGGENTVTLYGSVDEGVEYITGQAVGKGTASSLRTGWGTDTSFFGIRGNEALGGSLRAIWDLEGGFQASNGTASQGGRLFGRQSYVGVAGDFGSLTFGRQYTMRAYAIKPINPFGFGAQGLTTLDNGIANPRADNSISYRYHIDGFETGVNYSFGRDAVDGDSVVATNCPGETSPSNECREWSALLKYESRIWGIVSAYERNYGGTSATWGGLTSPKLTDSRFILGAYFNVRSARFGAGWIRRDDEGISTPKSNLVWVTGTVPVSPALSFDSEVAELKYDHTPDKAVIFVLRAVYTLSRNTALYVTGEHIKNSGALALSASTIIPVVGPPEGGSQTSAIAGIRHRF